MPVDRDEAVERDEALDRLIGAGPGEAAPEGIAADADLRELASLAHALRASGREHAREVNPAAGWSQLSAAIERTPQAGRGWLGWLTPWRGNGAPLFRTQAVPFPGVALAAVILGLSLLLAVPRDNASAAALLRDVDAMERTIAAVSAHGTISEEDRVELERTATAVLDRVSDETILRSVPPAQVEALAARLEEARRTLVTLPVAESSTGTTDSSGALASLSAASGFVESSLSSIVPPTPTQAPPKAAAKASASPTPKPSATPTRAPAAAPTSAPTRTPTASPTPTPRPATPTAAASNDRSGDDNRGSRGSDNSGPNRAAPAATPSVATLLDTVSPVCQRVYNQSTLGGCRRAVEAALAWCEQLPRDDARGCSAAMDDRLEAAERRVENLSDGCKKLNGSRSQKACQDSIEMSSYRPSRGDSGNTGRGDRRDD